MDTFLPQAIAESWTCEQLAAAAGLNPQTAARYLRAKADKLGLSTERKVMRVSSRAGAIFGDAASRQLNRLERLNTLPDDHLWSKYEMDMEKHAIALLKPLMDWCKMRTDAPPEDQDAPAQLSDGL